MSALCRPVATYQDMQREEVRLPGGHVGSACHWIPCSDTARGSPARRLSRALGPLPRGEPDGAPHQVAAHLHDGGVARERDKRVQPPPAVDDDSPTPVKNW